MGYFLDLQSELSKTTTWIKLSSAYQKNNMNKTEQHLPKQQQMNKTS